MAIRIIGTGSYAPEKILTNADLEKMVETSDEWITTRTGIKQRHIAADGVATSDLAVQAARNAMEMAKITPDQINFISVATVTGDKAFPSTACFVQKKIEANNAVCYDVVAACSGLLYSLEIAVAMLRSYKKYKYALVIGAEKLSSIVDWQDRSTCVLFGDGASAVILSEIATSAPQFEGVAEALADSPRTDIRLFGKPSARVNRRMGVVVGYEPHGSSLEALRDRVKAAAAKVKVTE